MARGAGAARRNLSVRRRGEGFARIRYLGQTNDIGYCGTGDRVLAEDRAFVLLLAASST